ncbi:hypothetical protein [Neobacillus vireti]|uniref:hypothetical protein n=1 Tax=Neobacillus vireti TaxID=220686 RepID=UPI003000C4BD
MLLLADGYFFIKWSDGGVDTQGFVVMFTELIRKRTEKSPMSAEKAENPAELCSHPTGKIQNNTEITSNSYENP